MPETAAMYFSLGCILWVPFVLVHEPKRYGVPLQQKKIDVKAKEIRENR
jgi:hypothetical protein